ncbi:MAG TPA: hypothetical protein VHZ56_09715 [Devosia sp.]|nr:hypothetical protein [Devosia sp.]
MKLLFADPTPRWVPFVAALLILGGVWFGANLSRFPITFTIDLVVGLAGVLLVALFFQGRYYWTGQVLRLSGDGMKYEIVTSVWIGAGRRIGFAATEAKEWSAKGGNPAASGRPELASVHFRVRGARLAMNFAGPKVIDLGGLSAINPAFFAKLRRDYPGLKSIGG